MERKKILKILLIAIAALLIIFIALTSRTAIILAKIDKKVSDYENNKDNLYTKTIATTNENTIQIDRFIKGDIDKMVLERSNKDGIEMKVIQIDGTTTHSMYTEKDGNKILMEYEYTELSPKSVRGTYFEKRGEERPSASYSVLTNVGYNEWFLQRILNSMFTKIKTVEIDGKEYYEMTNKNNFDMYCEENTKEMLMYVDKDTGLLMKQVLIFDEGDEKITTYEYKFDCVTDEDIAEPDRTEYKKV